MANEAVLFIETAPPVPFTVANGTGIEKGALCKLSDLMTAATSTAVNDEVAGIAASEKIINDGKVRLGIFREGYFKVKASGSIGIGDPVGLSTTTETNTVYTLTGVANLSGSVCLGISMEEVGDGNTFIVHLKPQALMSV
jgi:hypothetical protein